MNIPTVFLGGTCGDSKWRGEIKKVLKSVGFGWFDPVVADWNEEAQAEELKQRANCDICLYVITPEMKGVYSIAEVVDDSNKRPEKVIFVASRITKRVIPYDLIFDSVAWRSMHNVMKMVNRNDGIAISVQDIMDSRFKLTCLFEKKMEEIKDNSTLQIKSK